MKYTKQYGLCTLKINMVSQLQVFYECWKYHCSSGTNGMIISVLVPSFKHTPVQAWWPGLSGCPVREPGYYWRLCVGLAGKESLLGCSIDFFFFILFPQHQQQVAAAVERAKQVTMTELNAIIGVIIWKKTTYKKNMHGNSNNDYLPVMVSDILFLHLAQEAEFEGIPRGFKKFASTWVSGFCLWCVDLWANSSHRNPTIAF